MDATVLGTIILLKIARNLILCLRNYATISGNNISYYDGSPLNYTGFADRCEKLKFLCILLLNIMPGVKVNDIIGTTENSNRQCIPKCTSAIKPMRHGTDVNL